MKPEQKVETSAVASLVSMMKQTIQSGTAKLVTLSGFKVPAAGKTGTTSDNKDAWFAGFTPVQTSVVWVGYDLPMANGLTGASGAVPIWLDFMRKVASNETSADFAWPANIETRSIDREEHGEDTANGNLHFDLIFKK